MGLGPKKRRKCANPATATTTARTGPMLARLFPAGGRASEGRRDRSRSWLGLLWAMGEKAARARVVQIAAVLILGLALPHLLPGTHAVAEPVLDEQDRLGVTRVPVNVSQRE